MKNKINYLYILFLCCCTNSLFAQTSIEDFFYPSGSVSKAFDFIANDTVRFGIRFGTSRFEWYEDQKIGFHENAVVFDTSILEPAIYPSVFIDKLHADTILVNFFSLPNLPFEAFSQLTSFISEYYYVPAVIQSAVIDAPYQLKTFSIRVPFPDSLFPENPLITYPDSADIEIKANYTKRALSFTMDAFSAVEFTRSEISIEMNLKAEVKLKIGGSFTIMVPLLSAYPISILYGTGNIGFAGFYTEAYSLTWNAGQANLSLPEIVIPAVVIKLKSYWQNTATESKKELKPIHFSIYAFPNPFNPSTTIHFNLTQSSNVQLNLYNVLGSKLETLFSEKFLSSGDYSIPINGTGLASGTYFIQVQSLDNSGHFYQKVLPITLIK